MNVPSPPHVVHGNRITEPAAAVPAPNGDRYAELPDVTAPEGPPSSPSGTGSMIFESGDAA